MTGDFSFCRTSALQGFLASRLACPGCGAAAITPRSKFYVDFGCGSGFFASSERIEAKRPCPVASETAAHLWTIQAGGAAQ